MESILLLVTLAAFALYSLWGVVLAYHWVRYGASALVLTMSLGTYSVVGGYLLLVALVATL